LVIEQRLRQGRIQVIAFPAHPSHRLEECEDDPAEPKRCEQCMLKTNEEQIQFDCPLPAREILGPDSFGGSDYPDGGLTIHDDSEHPWIKRGPGPMPRTTAMPIPSFTDLKAEGPPVSVGDELRLHLAEEHAVCPACVLGNDPPVRVRLCVAHQPAFLNEIRKLRRSEDAGTERGSIRARGWNSALDAVLKLMEAE